MRPRRREVREGSQRGMKSMDSGGKAGHPALPFHRVLFAIFAASRSHSGRAPTGECMSARRLAAFTLVFCVLAPTARARGLQVGAAAVVITPEAGTPMAGYYTARA